MKSLYLTILILVGYISHAQSLLRPISVKEFMGLISDHPEIQASAEKVAAMKHGVDIAKISPDPSLTIGNVSGDISGINMPHQYFVGLDYTMETGGKRRHRVEQAKAAKDLVAAQHWVFVKEFRKNALILFQKCWIMQQRLMEFSQNDTLLQGVTKKDSISALKLNILRMENEVADKTLRYTYDKSVTQLNDVVSHRIDDSLVTPGEPVWDESAIVKNLHLQNHPGVVLIRAETRLQREEVMLAEANRIGDVSLTLGNNFITRATNLEAPSPHYNAITATISVPLKFSNLRGVERKYNSYRLQTIEDEEAKATTTMENELAVNRREVQQISFQINQIHSLISLEKKLITSYKEKDAEWLDALEKLWELQELRWEKVEQLALKKALFMDLSDVEWRHIEQLAGSSVK